MSAMVEAMTKWPFVGESGYLKLDDHGDAIPSSFAFYNYLQKQLPQWEQIGSNNEMCEYTGDTSTEVSNIAACQTRAQDAGAKYFSMRVQQASVNSSGYTLVSCYHSKTCSNPTARTPGPWKRFRRKDGGMQGTLIGLYRQTSLCLYLL